MTTQELKSAISQRAGVVLPTLNFVRQFNLNPDGTQSDEPTDWLSHWENTSRIRISMHQDVMATIKANPKIDTLAFKEQDEPAKGNPGDADYRASYKRFVVITPGNIEFTM